MNYTPEEMDEKLRRRVDQGEHDGYAADPFLCHVADTLRDLREALASQIEITNTLRAQAESLSRDLIAAESVHHQDSQP